MGLGWVRVTIFDFLSDNYYRVNLRFLRFCYYECFECQILDQVWVSVFGFQGWLSLNLLGSGYCSLVFWFSGTRLVGLHHYLVGGDNESGGFYYGRTDYGGGQNLEEWE